MTPDSKKEIWRDQAAWSRLGSKCLAKRDRMRFIGSEFENVLLGEETERCNVVKVVAKMR